MNFKMMTLLTLLLLAVLTIGAVSASDSSDDLTVNDEGDSLESSVDGDVLCDDEHFIFIEEDEICTDEDSGDYDADAIVAGIILPNDTASGTFEVSVNDEVIGSTSIPEDLEEDNNWEIDEDYNLRGHLLLSGLDLTGISNGDTLKFYFLDADDNEVEDYTKEAEIEIGDDYIKFNEAGGDDDSVIISVVDGDEKTFDLENDLNETFATVYVRSDLEGSIFIKFEDDEDVVFFDKSLDELDSVESEEYEGFNEYYISLNDLTDIDEFKSLEYFKIGFYSDDDEVASRNYNIDYSEDDNTICFWQKDDDNGEYLGTVIFVNGNAITNDVIIYVPKSDIEGVDDEFEVTVEADETTKNFKLSEINSTDDEYILKVLDLFEFESIGESYSSNIIIQFYKDGEKAYYSNPEDDEEGITVYTSPFVVEEAYLLQNSTVISFQQFSEVDDEFNVTVSKDGSYYTLTFAISELDNDDGFYELHLSDLNITQTGEYTVSVNFTNNTEQLAYNSGNVNVGNVSIIVDYEGESVSDVSTGIFIIASSEDSEGIVKIYCNGTQVGDDIDLTDLSYHKYPDGRKVLLNNFKITESGTYTLKVEVYDENGDLLGDCEHSFNIEVTDNNVEFITGPYGSEDNNIVFTISTPLSDNQYYNIYLNGVKAGNYTVEDGVVISDEFTDTYFEVSILKPGTYNVNVTFVDADSETDFKTGSFSINSLNITSDKEIYLYRIDNVLISFSIDEAYNDYRMDAYYLLSWDKWRADNDMIFNPYTVSDPEIYNDGVVTFDVAYRMGDEDSDNYGLSYGVNYIHVTCRPWGEDEVFGDIISVYVIDPQLAISVDNVDYGSDAVVKLTANELFSGDIPLQLDGTNYTVTLTNGTGTLAISNLAAGSHTAKAILYCAEVPASSIEESTTFTVNKIDPNLKITVSNINYGAKAVIKITTNTSFTGTVNVKIASKTYAVSVINGKGTRTVSGLAAGSYTAKATLTTTDVFTSSSKSVNFKVNTVIKLALAKATVKKSAKKLTLKATLKVNGKLVKGKKITFKFKGKTYTAKTSKKGVAKVTVKKAVLKKLKAGKKITYTAKYSTKTVKRTVKIKK